MQPLLQICIDAIAQALPLPVAPTPTSLPDITLIQRIYEAYTRLDQARRRWAAYVPDTAYSYTMHLAALRQLAALWLPSTAVITAPSAINQPNVALCAELATFSGSLRHLELSSPTASWLCGLQGLQHLTCLSLRGCPHLTNAAVQQLLQQLPQLTSLDLSGLAAVSDALAPTLVTLTRLVVLQLNHTSCGDSTVEWLTYGNRLHHWATAASQQHSTAGLAAVQHTATGVAAAPMGAVGGDMLAAQSWPRTKINSWHLAYTKVTPAVVDSLTSCPDIVLLDLRGSGVRAAQLGTLRAKHALSAVQGAVLSRTAAMVLAAVTLDQFVCCDAAQHGAAVAEIRVGQLAAAGQQSAGLQHWVNEGVSALLRAAAEASAADMQFQAMHPGGQHGLQV